MDLMVGNGRHRNKWFVEPINDDVLHVISLNKVEFSDRSKFQEVDVFNLGFYGRTLVLDNKLQSAAADEHAYHEPLVHPPMLHHDKPKTVFIGGGGEGATAREVLKHKTVEKCYMVDIDDVAVDMCRKHLHSHHQGAFDDPRLELVYDDAKKFLENYQGKFDVIILDLADPVEGGPCYQLYTDSWYQLCRSKLADDGVMVTQSGPCGILTAHEVFAPIYRTLETTFPGKVIPYRSHVPSFLDTYGFNMVSFGYDKLLSPEEIDKRIADRISGETRFYDGETHRALFNLEKPIRKVMKEETRVISKDNFVFMSGGKSVFGTKADE